MPKVISQAASFLEWGVASPAGSGVPLGTAGQGASVCTCIPQASGGAGYLTHSVSRAQWPL